MKRVNLSFVAILLCFCAVFGFLLGERLRFFELPTVDFEVFLLPQEPSFDLPSREEIWALFGGVLPTSFGEDLDGIVSVLPTDEKVVALTFDACGWEKGYPYDEALIAFLLLEEVPATLFLSGKWIEDNPSHFLYLAGQPSFDIENHGYTHRPLTVDGRAAYGIAGTGSAEEAYDEVVMNAWRIFEATGRRPLFFRAGTAFYDDVAVQIAAELNVRIAGYTIAGDGGATYSAAQILRVCENPPKGAILLFHMNHPESETYEGVRELVFRLREQGYSFVKLSDVV